MFFFGGMKKRLFSRMILRFAFWIRSPAHGARCRASPRTRRYARASARQTLRFSRRKRKKMLADFQEMLTMTA
jgi:hypothetical protein